MPLNNRRKNSYQKSFFNLNRLRKKPVWGSILSGGQLLVFLLWTPEPSFGYQLCLFYTWFILLFPVRPHHCAPATLASFYPRKSIWNILASVSLHLFLPVTLFHQKSPWLIPPHTSGIFTNVTASVRTSLTSLLNILPPSTALLILYLLNFH